MKAVLRLCIAAVLILSVTLTGCSAAKKTEGDRNKVVAEVNGEKILKGEVLDVYNSQKGSYNITDANESTADYKSIAANLKSSILEQLIYQKLIDQNAKKAGYSINNDILEQAKTQFNGIIKNIEEQMKTQEGGDPSGNTDYTQKANDYVNEQLKLMGKTQDQYINILAQQIITNQFMDKTVGTIEVSDAEIKSYYDSELKAQKEGASDATIQLYVSSGIRVKHILIALPQDEQDEYNNLISQQKTEEAKTYLDEKLKGIYPKAQEVLSKVKSGGDFDKLIEEYGEDPGMVGNTEGYTVRNDGQFVPEFQDAALKLKAGEVSGLVPTVYGYHIIKAYEIIKEKVYTLAEKKEEIKQEVMK